MSELKRIEEHGFESNRLNIGEEYRQPGRLYLLIKRVFDFAAALVASIILLPVLVLLCAFIMVMDFGNPFYVQRRVGEHGRYFSMMKLRSMKAGADDLEKTLTKVQLEAYLREYKLDDDPRLIGWNQAGDSRKCFGSLLRKWSLDELPQIFWNILIKGDMSFVGPRPILREELEKNYSPREQVLLLSVKPGLTGYWQAYARNNVTYENGERQQMELYYVKNQSLWLDVKILIATVGAVLKKSGAK